MPVNEVFVLKRDHCEIEGESRNPVFLYKIWIPAFAGRTNIGIRETAMALITLIPFLENGAKNDANPLINQLTHSLSAYRYIYVFI